MSFHPKMSYGAAFHKSARTLADPGPGFEYTPENRARFDQIVLRYEYTSGLRALGIRIRSRDRLWDRERGYLGFAQPPQW